MKHVAARTGPPLSEPKLGRSLAVLLVVFALVVFALGQSSLGDRGSAPSETQIGAAIMWPLFALATLLVMLLNAISVAAETSTNYLKPIHVKHLRERSERQGTRLQGLLDNRMTYVAACKLFGDLARLVLFLLVLGVAPSITRATGYPATYPNVLITAFATMIPVGLLNLVFELVPRSYASLHPHGTASRLYGFIRFASFILSVPAKIATGIASLLTARFGGQATFVIANQAEEEIKTIAATAEESGEIEVDERQLLHSVFEFSDTVAREVMTPRVDLDALPITSPPEDVMALIQESGHSRIPLFEQTDDQIVGIIHAKDLFLAMPGKTPVGLRQLMRPAIFVPENKNLHELLADMRNSRSQMVVVQDEFGGTAGIVTIEDIVEELVGDIVDEYDVEEPEVTVSGSGWIADGKTHIDDLNEEIGSNFSSEEFDTVGGFVFGLFGRQPKATEQIATDGYVFTVAETDGRRIVKLQVEKVPAEVKAQTGD